MAKTFTGDYRARFALALKLIREGKPQMSDKELLEYFSKIEMREERKDRDKEKKERLEYCKRYLNHLEKKVDSLEEDEFYRLVSTYLGYYDGILLNIIDYLIINNPQFDTDSSFEKSRTLFHSRFKSDDNTYLNIRLCNGSFNIKDNLKNLGFKFHNPDFSISVMGLRTRGYKGWVKEYNIDRELDFGKVKENVKELINDLRILNIL